MYPPVNFSRGSATLSCRVASTLRARCCRCAVAGCGVSQDRVQRARHRGRALPGRARPDAEPARRGARARRATAQGARGARRRDRARCAPTRAKLATNLQATQHEMEALRRVHAQAEQRNELYRTLVARLRDAIGARHARRRGAQGQDAGQARRRDPLRSRAGDAQDATGSARCARWRRRSRRSPIATSSSPGTPTIGRSRARPTRRTGSCRRRARSRWCASCRARASIRAGSPRPATRSSTRSPTTTARRERALNRRIEVVVMPRIDELPQIDISEPPAATPRGDDATPPPPGSHQQLAAAASAADTVNGRRAPKRSASAPKPSDAGSAASPTAALYQPNARPRARRRQVGDQRLLAFPRRARSRRRRRRRAPRSARRAVGEAEPEIDERRRGSSRR